MLSRRNFLRSSASGAAPLVAMSAIDPPGRANAAEPPVAPAAVAAQSRYASADAFHAAMLIGAGLLVAGAVANAIGVPRKQPEEIAAPSVS